MSQTYFSFVQTPIGELLVAGTESVLKLISFPGDTQRRFPQACWVEESRPLTPVIEQLKAYFDGKLRSFDLALSLEGTSFQKEVWQALQEIPYGQTASYGEIALKIGRPEAVRAVGMANGKNPLPIVIPCHRVIGKSGDLIGFGGGLELKEKLLSLERQVVSPQMNFSFPVSSE